MIEVWCIPHCVCLCTPLFVCVPHCMRMNTIMCVCTSLYAYVPHCMPLCTLSMPVATFSPTPINAVLQYPTSFRGVYPLWACVPCLRPLPRSPHIDHLHFMSPISLIGAWTRKLMCSLGCTTVGSPKLAHRSCRHKL